MDVNMANRIPTAIPNRWNCFTLRKNKSVDAATALKKNTVTAVLITMARYSSFVRGTSAMPRYLSSCDFFLCFTRKENICAFCLKASVGACVNGMWNFILLPENQSRLVAADCRQESFFIAIVDIYNFPKVIDVSYLVFYEPRKNVLFFQKVFIYV